MENSKRKTLEDLPQIVVNTVRAGGVNDDGYQSFELEVNFDSALKTRFVEMIDGSGVQWFWLLFGERGHLTPTLHSFDKQSDTAVLTCYEKEQPKVVGSALAFLSPFWQAFHVWMVLDPNWGWEKRQVKGIDALAEDYEANNVSVIDGREVRVWTKLEPVGTHTGQSRYYPADDQGLPVHARSRLVPGGWDHQHCQLCHVHIDAGTIGYCDSEEHWVCKNCHERYVSRHDLAFVDEL